MSGNRVVLGGHNRAYRPRGHRPRRALPWHKRGQARYTTMGICNMRKVTAMARPKGCEKLGGRRRGTPNKITAAFKDAVRIVYEDIGGHAAFAAWARKNPSEFYRIAARLIPTEVVRPEGEHLTVIVQRFPEPAALEDRAPRDRATLPMLPGPQVVER